MRTTCWPAWGAALLVAFATGAARGDDATTQKLFFENLAKLCGEKFGGATEFPREADHPLVGKKLTINPGPCSATEIRIPLRAGDDTSRTWIITLGAEGLLLKHDHRHPDGSPDKVTMYGGPAVAAGTPYRQRFAADAATAQMLPEAATNVWTLEIGPAKQQLVYALERHNQPRYRAVFSLEPVRE